jgi:hypothetical protein
MNHGLTSETVDRIRSVLACFPEGEKAIHFRLVRKGNALTTILSLLGSQL